MSGPNKNTLRALEAVAHTSAAYLDACDAGAPTQRLDPGYYRACGDLLARAFALEGAEQNFRALREGSAAAREIADAVQLGQRLETGRQRAYPLLAALLSRLAR